MAVTTCDGCGNKVNDQAAVCPHCGKRRKAASLAGSKPTQEEIVAMLAIENAARPTASEGLFQTLLLPHPATSGGARLAELVLTLVSFPLIIAGVTTFAFGRKSSEASRGELAPVLRMTLFGTIGMVSVLGFAGITTGTLLAITGVSVGALWVRGLIRAHSAKGPEL